ncbi:MAG: dihydroneopterin aldolase [Bacteroidaceae bacterium]|nr:dihydroneopterin aldolase [Bacteroidaceae bacterium]
MESTILLNNVRFHAFHGVMPQERSVGADFTLSLRLEADVWNAVWTDELNHTISYAEVYEAVADEMRTPSALLEHVAGRIVRRLFTTFPTLYAISIRLLKDNPPVGAQCDGMGVELTVSREEIANKLSI